MVVSSREKLKVQQSREGSGRRVGKGLLAVSEKVRG